MDIAPTKEEIITLFARGEKLVREMARRFGVSARTDIQIIEERFVTLHNAGTIDLLTLVEVGEFQRLQGTAFFAASYFLCCLLPKLNTTPDRMMRCVDELVTRGGQDGAANEPNAAFREWCAVVPGRAKEVIAAAHAGHELACQHLSFALEAVDDLIEARRFTFEYVGLRRQAAITALGRMKHQNTDSCAETFAIFNTLLDNGIEDSVRAGVLLAVMQILARDCGVSPENAEMLISRLVSTPGPLTLHQCARVLWAYRLALTENIVAFLLEALISLDSDNKGTVESLDLGLRALLEDGYEDAAVSFVTMLLSLSDNRLNLEELDSFTQAVLSGPPDLFSRLVVQWLQLGSPRLCGGLAKAIQGPGLDGVPLTLKAEDLNLSPATQLFICRKAVGWFFFKPTTAASVLVSVLRVCEEATARKVERLLVDPLLKNYGGVRDYLENLAPDDVASKSVVWALAQNDADLEAQRSVPLILELQPSEHHRRIESLRISDQFRDGHKQAQSGSVLLSMVSRSVLLYGNRSISFVDDGQDKLRPMEIDLHSHGISFEMPRMEVVDPVGLDYTLRVFRKEAMEK